MSELLVSLFLQSTQTLLSRVPQTTGAEFDQAVDAALQAYKTWSRTSVIGRQRFAIEYVIVREIFGAMLTLFVRLQYLIRKNADVLADSIVLEQGKTVAGGRTKFFYKFPSMPIHFLDFADAHGDILRGLQVVESAIGATFTLMGEKIEGKLDIESCFLIES